MWERGEAEGRDEEAIMDEYEAALERVGLTAQPPGSARVLWRVRILIAALLLLVIAPVAHGRVVVVATGTAQVQLIDTRRTRRRPVGTIAAVQAVAATPDGSRAVLATGRAVSVLDLHTRAVIGGTPLRGVPAALAVSPDGTRAYAARRNGIEVIDLATVRRTSVRALSGTPLDLAVTANRAVVVQSGGKVVVLNLDTGRAVRRLTVRGAAGVSIVRGQAWISATEPAKKKRKPRSRLVRVNPTSGGITGSVDLRTDGGGGVSVSPDGGRAIVAPGAKLAASTARPRSSTSRRARSSRARRPVAVPATPPTPPTALGCT